MKKIINITAKGLESHFAENPNQRLVCSDPKKCAIAQAVWDQVPDDLKPYLTVDVPGSSVRLVIDHDRFIIPDDYTPEGASYCSRVDLPDWAKDFVRSFDNDEGGRVKTRNGKKTLALLQSVLTRYRKRESFKLDLAPLRKMIPHLRHMKSGKPVVLKRATA